MVCKGSGERREVTGGNAQSHQNGSDVVCYLGKSDYSSEVRLSNTHRLRIKFPFRWLRFSLRTWATAALTWAESEHTWAEGEHAWAEVEHAWAEPEHPKHALSQPANQNVEPILASSAPLQGSLPEQILDPSCERARD